MPTLEELIGEEHVFNIAITGHGDEKLAFLEQNTGLVQQLLEMGFNGSHIYAIFYGPEYREKFDTLRRDYEGIWKPLGFTASNLAQIVAYADWGAKLGRIRTDYEQLFKPLGLEPTHLAQIVRGSGWKDKLEWLETHYPASTYTPAEIARIMQRADWRERVGYVAATAA